MMFRPPRRIDLVREYCDHLLAQGQTPATANQIQWFLGRWSATGHTPANYLQHMGPMAPGSFNLRRQQMLGFCRWRGADNWKQQVLAVPKRKIPKREQRTLSVPEIARLLDGCAQLGLETEPLENHKAIAQLPPEAYRARMRAMVAIQVTAGLRVSELCTILVAGVDMQKRTVQVIGKGDKQRTVRLGRSAWRMLQEWLPFRALLPGEFMFVGKQGQPVNRNVYGRMLTRAAWWADLGPVNPHMLRHTYATLALDAGVPVADLQLMLGHEQIATTMKYVHRKPGRGWDRYDLVDEAFGE